MKRILLFLAVPILGFSSYQLWAQDAVAPAETAVAEVAAPRGLARPRYTLRADIDTQLLTFNANGKIEVPVAAGDAVSDAVFFVFANAGGVGGDDERVKNVDVSAVKFGGEAVPFTLNGAVLRVKLPAPQRSAFALDVAFRGVVPRAPKSAGGIMEMMGGMDLGGLFGGAAGAPKEKPKNVDYGLYSYSNGVMSLGSFWYPTLAVRKDGKWIDEAPEGLGDVAYADMSDYDITLSLPEGTLVAAPGKLTLGPLHHLAGRPQTQRFQAENIRDFSVVLSKDFVRDAKSFDVAGKPVLVEAFTTKAHAAKGAAAVDIAGKALQVFAKRFGPYPYSNFKVVEGPIRGGAGGMEYSGMTTIATMLYGDLAKELGGLASTLGAPGVDANALEALIGDDDAAGEAAAAKAPAAAKPGAKAAPKAPADEDAPANPAADLLGGLLGGQMEVLNSMFEMTIAHEVAHQWWAIGVGSDSQRAPWLDESLTNYSAILYFEDRYGAQRAQKMMDTHLKTAYSTARMLGQKDAAVNLRTSAYDGNVQYGAVVYGKGALFYDALRAEIGDAAFFGGLRDYYAAHNGRLAVPADLQIAFTKRAPAKKVAIAALWKRWIEGQHGDDDITGGAPGSIADMLGGLFGGGME